MARVEYRRPEYGRRSTEGRRPCKGGYMEYRLFNESTGEIVISEDFRQIIGWLRKEARYLKRVKYPICGFRVECDGAIVMDGSLDLGFVWFSANGRLHHI